VKSEPSSACWTMSSSDEYSESSDGEDSEVHGSTNSAGADSTMLQYYARLTGRRAKPTEPDLCELYGGQAKKKKKLEWFGGGSGWALSVSEQQEYEARGSRFSARRREGGGAEIGFGRHSLKFGRKPGALRCQSRTEFEAEADAIIQKYGLKPDFEGNGAKLAQDDYPVIDELADLVKEHPGVRILVDGHADTGQRPEPRDERTVKWLRDLCLQRAQAVKRRLVQRGVSSDAVDAKGSGAVGRNPITREPVEPNLNKRVYITVTGGLPMTRGAGAERCLSRPEFEAEADEILKKYHMKPDFEGNGAKLAHDDYPVIDELADLVKEHPGVTILVDGHADTGKRPEPTDKRTVRWLRDLCLQRAQAVKRRLVEQGVSIDCVEVKGSGATGQNPITGRPVEPNSNKRVYISVTGGLPQTLAELEPEPEQEPLEMIELKKQYLSSVHLLKELPEDAIEELAMYMTAETASPGDVIIREGEVGAEMYFVVYGCADVLVGGLNHWPVANIYPGQFFGEMALLGQEKRNAFIRAATDMDLLVLTKLHLDTMFKDSPELEEVIRLSAARRAKPELISSLLASVPKSKLMKKKQEVLLDDEIDGLVEGMSHTMLRGRLIEAGIECDAGASDSTMQEALKSHYRKVDMTVEEVFHALDTDESGYLEHDEIERGAGMLGAKLHYIIGDAEMEKELTMLDVDGDGQVSFEEFVIFWDAVEIGVTVDHMDRDELEQELEDARISFGIGVQDETLREAVKAHRKNRPMTVEQTFEFYDVDDSGFLDRLDLSRAAGSLGCYLGSIMTEEELDHQFHLMDPDGDGIVSLDEFKLWWKACEADDLIQGMDLEDVNAALSEAGIELEDGVAVLTMREALKAHYSTKEDTPQSTFAALDVDGSGALDREELGKAAGVLGATLGFIMSEKQLDHQFKLMDPDGDGVITIDEFEVWWKENEAERLVRDMDDDDLQEALTEVGIASDQGASVVTLKEALKSFYSGKEHTAKSTFTALDVDGSGSLDREELGLAAGVLGSTLKYVMSETEIDHQFKLMDPDGDGIITFEEFEEFWKEVEIHRLVGDMDTEDVKEALDDIGIETKRGVSQLTMREALKAHYTGKIWTAHLTFDRLDTDNSGKLDRKEMQQAAGVLGTSLKYVMTVDEVNRQFEAIDDDGNGYLTFEEFQRWWDEFETDHNVEEMDAADLFYALQEANIDAEGASVTMMRDALRARTKGKLMTVRSMFNSLDEDGSGSLDREEMEKAAAMLGAQLGFLMNEEQIDHQWALMDPDGDGDVTFEEFQTWWKGVESDKKVEDMDDDQIEQELLGAGIHIDTDGAAPETVKQALKAHYRNKDVSVRQVFVSLDEDGSGALERPEIEKAAGILGARSGFVMSAEDLEHQIGVMDPDGDEIITFDEFETWWKNVEADQKVIVMDDEDIMTELEKANIKVHEGATPETMKEALKAHYRGKEMTLRQVFDTMDEDKSGYLDQDEVGQAAAMLATAIGFVMSPEELEEQVQIMDGPDGDGIITFEEFEAWWKNLEIDTKVEKLEGPEVKDLLEEAGIEVRAGAEVTVMKEALRDQLKGKKMSPKQVFEALDDDGSGFLDKDEVANAAGVLASHLGFVMSGEDLEMQFQAMDPDGDGVVTLDEFKEWWCGVTVDVMDEWDVTAACKRGGLVLMAGGVPPVVQREALRMQMSHENPTPREVFEQIAYSDKYMTKSELETAVGMLGAGKGVLLSQTVIDHAWSILDEGEDNKIPFTKFEQWWMSVDYGELAPKPAGPPQDPTLPHGWAQREHEGKMVYINRDTGEQTWDKPSMAGQSQAVQAAAQAAEKEHEEEDKARLLALEMAEAEQAEAKAKKDFERVGNAMDAKRKAAKREVEQAKKRGDAEAQEEFEAVQKEAKEAIAEAQARAQEAADAAIAAIEAASAAETAAIEAAIEAAETRRVAMKEADAEAQRKAEFMAVAAASVAIGATPPVFEDSNSDPGDTPFSPKAGDTPTDDKLMELEAELKDVEKYVAKVEKSGSPEEKAEAAKVLEGAQAQLEERRTTLVALEEATVQAQQQGKVGAGINMQRVEPADSEEATTKYRNAGVARLDSRSGIPAIKYTSGKPPARQQRFIRITDENKDILWCKKEGASGTLLCPRHGEVTRLVHGMALKSRKAKDIRVDKSWLSFFIIAKPEKEKEQRVYQFSFENEELFTQAFLALHNLLREYSADPRQTALIGMTEEMTIIDVQEMMKEYKRQDDAQHELCGLSHFVDWKSLARAPKVDQHEVKKPDTISPLQEATLNAKVAKANATVAEAQSQAMYEAANRPVPNTEKQMKTELAEFEKLVETAEMTKDEGNKADALADLGAAEARVEQRRAAIAAVEEQKKVEAELEAVKVLEESKRGGEGDGTPAGEGDEGAAGTGLEVGGSSGGKKKGGGSSDDGKPSKPLTPEEISQQKVGEAEVAAKWALSAADGAETDAQEMYEAAGKPYPKTLKKAEKELAQARTAVKRAKPAERNLAKVELAQAEMRVKKRRQAEGLRMVAMEEVELVRQAAAVVRAEERAKAEAEEAERKRKQAMKDAEVEAIKFLASFGPKYENMEMFEVKEELKHRNISVAGSQLELIERLANDLDKEAEKGGLMDKVPMPITPKDFGIGGAKAKNEKYGDMSKGTLKQECAARGLPDGGGPDKMIDRLARDDRQRQKEEMERKTEAVPEGRGGKKLNTAPIHESVTPFGKLMGKPAEGLEGEEEEEVPLESAAEGKTPEELARAKKQEDLQRVMEAREKRAAEREQREEERERRAVEREARAEKAEQEANARHAERAARRQARIAAGGNATDEESDQEEEQKRQVALEEPPEPTEAEAEAAAAPAPKKKKKKKKPSKMERMKDAATAAVQPEVAGAEPGADSDSSSSDDDEEGGDGEGGADDEGATSPSSKKKDVGWLGPVKPRFEHNPEQLAGVDGGMRMTALCREPVRKQCYRGGDHTGYYLFAGETFEFITMKPDDQGTKRLKIKTRDDTVGWIRAKAGHTRPKYRVLKDRTKVRESHERHSPKVGRLEKGMIITCEESIQEFNVVKEGRRKGQSVEQTRVRFEHSSGLAGWVSVRSREGKTLCELMGVAPEKIGIGLLTPGERGLLKAKSQFL
jgi:Ca2+-binding EF-hand superfamily protein/outer membrane protein OmpA-like peptidoglycan-associated protein